MPKGSATGRRAGPPPDPKSGRSEQRGFKPDALPSEGFKGRVPAFPIPPGPKDTTFRAREMAIWRQVWRTPQACQWDRERYRLPVIAKYCRLAAITERDPGASAALLSRERELRLECGLGPDGLRLNGWAIAVDQVAVQAAKKAAPKKADDKAPPTRRLRSVSGGA